MRAYVLGNSKGWVSVLVGSHRLLLSDTLAGTPPVGGTGELRATIVPAEQPGGLARALPHITVDAAGVPREGAEYSPVAWGAAAPAPAAVSDGETVL